MNSELTLPTMQEILASIISMLPRYPEEGSQSSSITTQKLVIQLIEQFGTAHSQTITTTLNLVENLLTKFVLLNSEQLSCGIWQFVSHPAQLCALSLLHTLADPQQRLFPSDFWHTDGVGTMEKDQQKEVLKALELRRYEHHHSKLAIPIRFVYVAWGILKLEDNILFHQREAEEHAKEFVLIGGRTNMRDLKQVTGDNYPIAELLATLQTANSPHMLQALDCTLRREFAEETTLLHDAGHYQAQPWRDLKPWRNCMGASPNYALTEYFIRIYHLTLSQSGYFVLCQAMQQRPHRLIQCTLDDIAQGCTSDGAKILRIEAIYDDFIDRQALVHALQQLPTSYDACKYIFPAHKGSLTFSNTHPIQQGTAGKEKPLSVTLTPQQNDLLLGLAAHARGWKLQQTRADGLCWYPYGWLELQDTAMQHAMADLNTSLRKQNLPILELLEERYVRLSLDPKAIFLDFSFFSYNLQQAGKNCWQWQLHRQAITTQLGTVISAVTTVELKSGLAMSLQRFTTTVNNEVDINRDRELPRKIRLRLQDTYQALGLKIFLIIRDKKYRLSCKYSDTMC